MFQRTIALCEQFLEMGVPGLDFLVWRDGKEFFRHTCGYSDIENQIPFHGTERLRLFSCTKPITVTAAMQLWEQGKFRLDDPLCRYLPAFTHMQVQTEEGCCPAERPITIRDLFTMTAGFSYNYRSPALLALREAEPMPSTRQVIDALAQDPLLFQPSDRYNYSLCHDVLGALIEVWSGQRLEDYVADHIFRPLGMTQTAYQPGGEPVADLAPLYRFNKETGDRTLCPSIDRVGPCFVSGGGGCLTTAADYMRFAEALRTGERLLKRQTIALMTQNHLSPHQRRTFTAKTLDYGLGMWVPMAGQLRQDFGWGGAGGVLLAVDPGRGLSMVYMQHMLHSPNQGLRSKLIRTFLADLEGRDSIDTLPTENKNYNLTY